MLLAIVLIRTGGQGVYADPGSLIVYGVAIGGMVLASRVMVTAQRLAETNARQAELQAAELARYNIELARLNQLSARLQVCPTVVEATQIIAETLVDLFPTSSGTLYVRNQAAQEFHATARWGSNPPQAQVLSAISSEEFPHQLTDMVAFPLRAQEDTLGVLYIRRAPDIATDAEYQLLRAIADHSALALATIDLREQLQIQALHDPLTGLFNRRAMEEAFGRELHRAHRNQRALGVILLDLDYFKSFNDTWGHAAGDSVLPDTEITPTWKRAEDLRMAVEALHIQHDGQPLGQVTISIGVATFPEHGTTAAALIHAADTALYQAKARGRNCVCVANQETQVPTTDHSMLSGEDR